MTMIDREIAAWRRETRTRLLAARGAVTPAEYAEKSARVLASVQVRWQHGACVGAYWPMQGEIDPDPLLERLRQQGSTLALPVVVGRGLPLEFRAWQPGEPLAQGPFGTQHPVHGGAVHPSVLLVPVVGFDEQNYRLGYGGGYYDRTLAAMHPRPFTIGLGFELNRLATIHPQAHDIPLDEIVTESNMAIEP